MKTKQTQKMTDRGEREIMDGDWSSREWGIQGLISARWENERGEQTRELRKGESKVNDWRNLAQQVQLETIRDGK